MNEKQLNKLPSFITTRHLERLTGRSPKYLIARMPPRTHINERLAGWPRDVVINWMKQHPEAINHG